MLVLDVPLMPAQIHARLQQCSAAPDFNNYLVYLLGQAAVSTVRLLSTWPRHLTHTQQDKPLDVRQSAGLLLKNNLRSSWATLSPQVQQYVKVSVPNMCAGTVSLSELRCLSQACLLHCLALPERQLRTTAGTAVRSATGMRCLSPLVL